MATTANLSQVANHALTLLPLPNMLSTGAVHGIGRQLFCELPFANWARLGHHVCHNLASPFWQSPVGSPCTSATRKTGGFMTPLPEASHRPRRPSHLLCGQRLQAILGIPNVSIRLLSMLNEYGST